MVSLIKRSDSSVGRRCLVSRKRYRKKRRSCAICKPDKRGLAVRWTPKDLALLRQYEKARDRGWVDE